MLFFKQGEAKLAIVALGSGQEEAAAAALQHAALSGDWLLLKAGVDKLCFVILLWLPTADLRLLPTAGGLVRKSVLLTVTLCVNYICWMTCDMYLFSDVGLPHCARVGASAGATR